MINRVVRMAFQIDKIEDFISVFNKSKQKIAAFPGCLSLKLCKDPSFENVYYTFSVWENESDLENYRKSDLFKTTWEATKILFSEKPMAFSLEDYDVVKIQQFK